MKRSDLPPNKFEPGIPRTAARDLAEADIEALRQKGGMFVEAVRATRMPMALTDPNLPGNPIVFANESFLKLSGYRMEEVLGQQPHFMNGRLTDPNDAARFAEAIRSDHDDLVETIQYRKDGSRFVATVLISAFKDAEGRVLNHFMSWLDVTRRVDAEVEVADLKLAQVELHDSHQRHAFLLQLSDALRSSRNTDQAIAEASRLLGERLGASRVIFGEIDEHAGIARLSRGWAATGAPPHPAELKLTDFGGPLLDDLRNGRVVRYDDVGDSPHARPDLAALAAIGIRAGISAPLLVEGRFVFNLNVHQDRPRRWTDGEAALVEEVAKRTWAAVERARAEAALRENEDRHKLAIEVGQFASWDWELSTGKVAWNDRHYLVQGYAISEVPPSFEAWIARLHPEDRDEAVARIETARDTKSPYAHEFRTLHPDGTVRWCSARGRFFYDESGDPQRMIGVMEDTTDQKEAVEALRDSEEQLRLIVESARDYAIFTLDSEGVIKAWLAGAENVFGWTKAEAEGQPVAMTFTPEDRAAGEHVKELETARTTGSSPDVRWHLRKDGTRVYIEGHCIALRDEQGAVDGFLKIGQDTTEKHRAAELQSTLLAELQHRVRNTLGVIKSIVRRTADTSETVDDMASHLEGRLTAFARVQSMVTRDAKAAASLQAIVQDELVSHGAKIGQAVTVDGPDLALDDRIAIRLSLAIHELATNAVKYGPLGACKGTLSVTWAVADDCLHFEWVERCPPRPSLTRSRQGFGTELLERLLPYELGANVSIDFPPTGAVVAIKLPLS